MGRTAVYPGTFDPITNGHLDVIDRARRLFDRVIVAVSTNSSKTPLFTIDERIELIQNALGDSDGVAVTHFEGLLVDYVRKAGADALVRGLRAISDFEYEFQMALMNRKIGNGVTTVFLMPHENYTYLNSTIVKEIARFGGDIDSFVAPNVAEALKEKLK